MAKHRSGIVGVLGQTNVGKSTFLNAVIGEKLLITSPKPQATRNRVRCIYTTAHEQIVFVDTPGLHRPHNELSQHILREAFRSLRELDVILYMVAPWGRVSSYDKAILEGMDKEERPIILLVNKMDTARGNALEETLLAYDATGVFCELVPISSTAKTNIDEAITTILPYLPEGQNIFPADVKIDRPLEFLVAELIREKVFLTTFKEIPYKTAVLVKWLHRREDGLIEITADIIVDSKSHKRIIIGTRGNVVRKIGCLVRPQIEALLGAHIYLQLLVKVKQGWTKDKTEIQRLAG